MAVARCWVCNDSTLVLAARVRVCATIVPEEHWQPVAGKSNKIPHCHYLILMLIWMRRRTRMGNKAPHQCPALSRTLSIAHSSSLTCAQACSLSLCRCSRLSRCICIYMLTCEALNVDADGNTTTAHSEPTNRPKPAQNPASVKQHRGCRRIPKPSLRLAGTLGRRTSWPAS